MSVEVDLILDKKAGAGRDALIPILQEVQEAEGYLSKKSVAQIAEKLDLPSSKIFGVATFYNQFRFKPLGKNHVQICRGTACHVKGSASIMDRLVREIGVGADETTGDGVFSLEVVACIGACGLAPVISVNGEFYANLESEDVPKILAEYRNKENA
jgi:NADH-quinone oxidoreductase E subunit